MESQETYKQGKATFRRRVETGTYFNETTAEAVKRALDTARERGTRVRLFLGDVATGKAWGEENDVTGRIGRSMGPCKISLLLRNSRSMGGGAILDSCIIGIKSTAAHWLYKHENFSVGVYTLKLESCEVYHNGELVARFPDNKKALRWIAFMRGERFNK